MPVRFIYKESGLYDGNKELLIANIVNRVRDHIDLPEEVEIEMLNLGESSYGQTVIDPRFKKRMRVNAKLDIRAIIFPVVHELIHLHQIHTGKLMARRDGSIIWEGTLYNVKSPDNMTYKDYCNLPWELDATKQQKRLLTEILGI